MVFYSYIFYHTRYPAFPNYKTTPRWLMHWKRQQGWMGWKLAVSQAPAAEQKGFLVTYTGKLGSHWKAGWPSSVLTFFSIPLKNWNIVMLAGGLDMPKAIQMPFSSWKTSLPAPSGPFLGGGAFTHSILAASNSEMRYAKGRRETFQCNAVMFHFYNYLMLQQLFWLTGWEQKGTECCKPQCAHRKTNGVRKQIQKALGLSGKEVPWSNDWQTKQVW